MCISGIAVGRWQYEPHPIRMQKYYDDNASGLRHIKLTARDSLAAYTCRRCGEWQGCAHCIDDIASMVCSQCRDWANDLSEQVHGRMVSRELAREGLKIVEQFCKGRINRDDMTKLWADACSVLGRKGLTNGPG
jgi:hypothetical protein